MEGYELAFPVATPSSSSSGAPYLMSADALFGPGVAYIQPGVPAPDAGTTDAIAKWWDAAALRAPFTPDGTGGNDGFVRDANGDMIANCFGWESRADVIAALLNRAPRSLAERQGAEAPPKLREIL